MIRRTWLLALWLVACKGTDLDKYRDGDREAALRETLDLNLQKTRAFFVTGAPEGDQQTSQLTKLVAVQDDGTTVEVNVTTAIEDDGSVVANGVIDTPAYLFFAYENVEYKGKQCRTIPVRKSDNRMFCVEAGIGCGRAGICGGTIKATADGSHIYMMANGSLLRLELRGIADSQQVEISSQASGGNVTDFMLKENGDVLATVYQESNSGDQDVRHYRTGGGFVNLGRDLGDRPPIFVGPGEGNTFYWIDGYYDGANSASLHQVFDATDPVTGATIFSDTGGMFRLGSARAATAEANYALYDFNAPGNPENRVIEVINKAGKPRAIDFPGLQKITTLEGCNDHLVLGGIDQDGNEVILRHYAHVPTSQTLAATKDYIISKLSVDSKCRITFGGRRASDNARIVGQIEPGSDTVNVVAKDLSADVTQIQAIY